MQFRRFHRQGLSGIQDYSSDQGGLYDRRNRTDAGINCLFRSDRIHRIRRLKIRSVLPSGKMSKTRTITVEKQSLAPAKEVAKTTPGLEMQVTDGMFLNSSKLGEVKEWKKSVIKDLREITSVVKTSESMRGVKQYAAIATGYVNIPEDGVYYISSDNEEVWIDGKLLVNNGGEGNASPATTVRLHCRKACMRSRWYSWGISLVVGLQTGTTVA